MIFDKETQGQIDIILDMKCDSIIEAHSQQYLEIVYNKLKKYNEIIEQSKTLLLSAHIPIEKRVDNILNLIKLRNK